MYFEVIISSLALHTHFNSAQLIHLLVVRNNVFLDAIAEFFWYLLPRGVRVETDGKVMQRVRRFTRGTTNTGKPALAVLSSLHFFGQAKK
jgi:hypothetical protein